MNDEEIDNIKKCGKVVKMRALQHDCINQKKKKKKEIAALKRAKWNIRIYFNHKEYMNIRCAMLLVKKKEEEKSFRCGYKSARSG